MPAFVETPRLLLRKVGEEDYPYFREYLSDREMDEVMLRNPCETEEDLRLGFEWFLYREERAYVIILKESGGVIGNLTVYNRVPEEIAELDAVREKNGKSLSFALKSAFRRRGLMQEAVSAVIDRLFREENTDYIHCGCLVSNEASRALQEKLNFALLMEDRFSFDDREITALEHILWKEEKK